jgi:hypothetical protein
MKYTHFKLANLNTVAEIDQAIGSLRNDEYNYPHRRTWGRLTKAAERKLERLEAKLAKLNNTKENK